MRQAVVAMLAPAVALMVLSPLSAAFAVPLLVWLAACLAGGAAIALQTRSPSGLLSGFVAGSMHLAWSIGVWRQWLAPRPRHVMAAAR